MKKLILTIAMSLICMSPAFADVNLLSASYTPANVSVWSNTSNSYAAPSNSDENKVNTVGNPFSKLHTPLRLDQNPIKAYNIGKHRRLRFAGITVPGIVSIINWSFINNSQSTVKVVRFFLIEVSPFGEIVYKYRFDAVGDFKPGIEYKKIGSIQVSQKDAGTHWVIKDTKVMYENGAIWDSPDTNLLDY